MSNVKWKPVPDDHDYDAAEEYLSLILDPESATNGADMLRISKESSFKAKDILRASDLALLPKDNFHVAKDLARIEAGTPLSPVLLVRDPERGRVVIADGYHRVCAVYHDDEDAVVRCRIW